MKKIAVSLFLIGVFAGFVSVSLAAANHFEFSEQNGLVIPAEQSWQVIDVRLSAEAPRDLRGLPAIMRGSPVVFASDYAAIMSPNSGGMMLLPTCFAREGDQIHGHAIPGLSGSSRHQGFKLDVAGDQVLMDVDARMTLVLGNKGYRNEQVIQVLSNAPKRMQQLHSQLGKDDPCLRLLTQLTQAPELADIRGKLEKRGAANGDIGRSSSKRIARTLSTMELEQWIQEKRTELTLEDYWSFLEVAYQDKEKSFEKAAMVSRNMPSLAGQREFDVVSLAIFYRDVPTLLRLLHKVKPVAYQELGWLNEALRTADPELLEIILDSGARPEVNDAFMSAVAGTKNVAIVKLLERRGIDTSKLMRYAIAQGERDMVNHLLASGKKVLMPRDYLKAEEIFSRDKELLNRLRLAIAFDDKEIERLRRK